MSERQLPRRCNFKRSWARQKVAPSVNPESARQLAPYAGYDETFRPVWASNPNPAKPNSDNNQVDGSGTVPPPLLITEKLSRPLALLSFKKLN